MKKVIAKLLGSPRRKYLRWTRRMVMKSPSIEQRFNWVSKNNAWGNDESVSGPGSTLAYTANLRKRLPPLFRKYAIRVVFDAPCGDFNWMKEVVRAIPINYLGGDIVRPLVDMNRQRYQSEQVAFRHFDITKDIFPDADILICRDCLFHLSFADIESFLKGFVRSNIRYLLTTTHINDGFENRDILSGGFRKIDLFKGPFFFPTPLEEIDDWIEPQQPRVMGLWRREDLRELLAAG